ncbi:unnamed protein product [Cuscuta epithymum]|uniref:Peptidase A1 domain-containing protein n=1 Tax=Cuscuta epithymum TaxID=186058 RepID=A0AAV0EPT6_9ASTE|nr:unnamed protein product [Cuscuta epithymum]
MSSFNQLFCTIIILSLFQVLSFPDASPEGDHTMVSKLVYILPPDSPHFNSLRTPTEKAYIELESSLYRASYLLGRDTGNFLWHTNADVNFQIMPKIPGVGFLAHVKVGSKNVDQYLYMDTGSSLLWVKCGPTKDYTWPLPIYIPNESSTFQLERCLYTSVCDLPGLSVVLDCQRGNKRSKCTFFIKYANNESAFGVLGSETFKVGRSTQILKDVVFGCANESDIVGNGILGLSPRSTLSFLSQRKASKFAYCIGNLDDASYPYNTLVVGNAIDLRGTKTKLYLAGHYIINLEGIIIGEEAVQFNPTTYRRNINDHTGGMIIDSGSTYTYFPFDLLSKVEYAIKRQIDSYMFPNYVFYHGYPRLCYNGVLKRDLHNFPVVLLKFEGGGTITLTIVNLFKHINEQTFCLAILPTELALNRGDQTSAQSTRLSIMGITMQQYFYVAFDVRRMEVSFLRIDCSEVGSLIHDEL